MNSSSDNSERLLSSAGQWTEPWGPSRDGARCDKCEGSGQTRYECWSCLLSGTDPACPACLGAVRWDANCPVCHGSAEIDGEPRHGVSAFPTVEGLYHYMIAKGVDLERCVILELEAVMAQDVDFDADQGALLVLPTEIVGRHPLDADLANRIRSYDDRALTVTPSGVRTTMA